MVGLLRERDRGEVTLAAESEADLARILADLNAEADALQTEIGELRVQLSELRRATRSEAAAAAAAEEQLRTLQVLAGTVPVTGPGVAVVIDDPQEELTYDVLIDVVQELKDAGAEAVAVNGVRIGVSTAFAQREGAPAVGGTALDAPYRIEAIGQPATLEGGLKIPGGIVDTVAGLRGASIEIRRQARLDLPAVAPGPA